MRASNVEFSKGKWTLLRRGLLVSGGNQENIRMFIDCISPYYIIIFWVLWGFVLFCFALMFLSFDTGPHYVALADLKFAV